MVRDVGSDTIVLYTHPACRCSGGSRCWHSGGQWNAGQTGPRGGLTGPRIN